MLDTIEAPSNARYHDIEQALYQNLAPCELLDLWNDFVNKRLEKSRLIRYTNSPSDVDEAFQNNDLGMFLEKVIQNPNSDFFDYRYFSFDGRIDTADCVSGLSVYDDRLLIAWLLEDEEKLQGYANALNIH